MLCCNQFGVCGTHFSGCFRHPEYVEPLAPWEKQLLRGEGNGDVTFHCKDDVAFTIKDVKVDSISGTATNKGVITGEFFESDEMFHVPNVLYWTISY